MNEIELYLEGYYDYKYEYIPDNQYYFDNKEYFNTEVKDDSKT